MTRSDRELRHRARLAQIEQVQVVDGRGDRARLDHEATVLERARMFAEELQSHAATERGIEALERLLRVLEEGGSRQAPAIATFLDAVWNHRELSLRTLRSVDARTGDDMVAVLDAYRYASADLPRDVAGGARRLARALPAQRGKAASPSRAASQSSPQ